MYIPNNIGKREELEADKLRSVCKEINTQT